MKRIFKSLKNVLGLVVLTALTLGLVWLFSAVREGMPVGLLVSPIKTPPPATLTPRATPTPPQPTPSRGTPTAILTPRPSFTPLPTRLPTRTPPPHPTGVRPKGAPIPEPTWERPFQPVNKPEDAVSVVVNDPGFQSTLDGLFFGSHSREALPGTPVYVKALDGEYPGGYYVVPFYDQGKLVGIAAVGLRQEGGRLVMWSKAEAPRFPSLNAEEARNIVEGLGYWVLGEPELVYCEWKVTPHFRYGGSPAAPFWKLQGLKGKTFYVLYDFSKKRPRCMMWLRTDC